MKDYLLRDGGKLKKIGIKKKVRSVLYKFTDENNLNSIMRILKKLTADLKYEEIS